MNNASVENTVAGKGGEALVKHMVDRFLGWMLPDNFSPDCGISFKPPSNRQWGPTGTNLFDYRQAEAMVRYMLEGLPLSTGKEDGIARLRRDCAEAYQVIGVLAGEAFDSPQVTKALDNLSAAASGEPRPHDDLLPFTLPLDEGAGASSVAISVQDPELLLNSLLHFGRSPDGSVERDLLNAIRQLKARAMLSAAQGGEK